LRKNGTQLERERQQLEQQRLHMQQAAERQRLQPTQQQGSMQRNAALPLDFFMADEVNRVGMRMSEFIPTDPEL